MENHKLKQIQDSFIESISTLSSDLGINKAAAQLYALLFLFKKPLSLDKMAEELGISKGNVSVNIRELEKWGAVRKVWVRGSRKDYYEAESDVIRVVTSRTKARIQRRLDDIKSAIDRTEELLNSGNKEFTKEEKKTASIYKERLDSLKNLHNMLKGLIDNGELILKFLENGRGKIQI